MATFKAEDIESRMRVQGEYGEKEWHRISSGVSITSAPEMGEVVINISSFTLENFLEAQGITASPSEFQLAIPVEELAEIIRRLS
jgi:hypothetical protein